MRELTIVVHWLHVLGGIVWFGGHVFTAAVIWPALLRRPATEAKALSDAMAVPAMRVMGPAGMLVLVLGIVRGTVLGPVRSLDVLIGTAYGWTFLAALLLTFGLMGYAGATRQEMERRVWDGDRFHPGAAAWLRRSSAINLGGLAVILACMVLMRFGL
jgi:putative copper export protein